MLQCGGFTHVSADTRAIEASSPEDLREELRRLEAEEKQQSAQRRFLHQQIDFGYASDQTRAREREVSDEQRRLHEQIDALRAILGPEA